MPASRRGVTLIEMMMTGAIMAVTLMIATSVFVAVVTQKRAADRLLGLQEVSVGAMAELELDLANAGFRFPAPAFAVHVFNAPTQLVAGGGGVAVIDAAGGCGSGGLAAEADAVEVVRGSAVHAPGRVQAVDSFPPVAGTTDHNVVLTAPTPFTTLDVGPSGVALFYDAQGESCIGEVTDGPGPSVPPNMNVRMLDRDFNPVSGVGYYPSCPRAGMAVFRIERRRRYFLCSESALPDGGNPQTALFRQTTGVDGGYSYEGVSPERIQDGVEDLQLAARVYAGSPSTLAATDVDCFPALGAGRPYCLCNQTAASACDLGDSYPTLDNSRPASGVSGLHVSITALGTRPAQDPQASAGRPQSRDHAAGTVADGRRRLVVNTTIGMNNLTQVRP